MHRVDGLLRCRVLKDDAQFRKASMQRNQVYEEASFGVENRYVLCACSA